LTTVDVGFYHWCSTPSSLTLLECWDPSNYVKWVLADTSLLTLDRIGTSEFEYPSSMKTSSDTSWYFMIVLPPFLLGALLPALEMLWELFEGVSIFWTLMLKFASSSLNELVGILSLDWGLVDFMLMMSKTGKSFVSAYGFFSPEMRLSMSFYILSTISFFESWILWTIGTIFLMNSLRVLREPVFFKIFSKLKESLSS
jgi:hypothetical protein